MNLQIYWLVIAPTLLLGLSAIGWVGLWVTRPHRMVTSDFDRVFA